MEDQNDVENLDNHQLDVLDEQGKSYLDHMTHAQYENKEVGNNEVIGKRVEEDVGDVGDVGDEVNMQQEPEQKRMEVKVQQEPEQKVDLEKLLVYRSSEKKYAKDYAIHIRLSNPENIRQMTRYEQKNKYKNYSYVLLRHDKTIIETKDRSYGKKFRRKEQFVKDRFREFLGLFFQRYENILSFSETQQDEMMRWLGLDCYKNENTLIKHLDKMKSLMELDRFSRRNEAVYTMNYKLNRYFREIKRVEYCITNLIFLIQCLFSTCVHVGLSDGEVVGYNTDSALVTVWLNGNSPGYIHMVRGNHSYALNIYQPNKKCYIRSTGKVFYHINELVPFTSSMYAPSWVRWNAFLLFRGGICNTNAKYIIESKQNANARFINRFFNRNTRSEMEVYNAIKKYELQFVIVGNDELNRDVKAVELLTYLKASNIQEYALSTLPEIELLEKAALSGNPQLIQYLVNQRVADGFEPRYGFRNLLDHQKLSDLAEYTYFRHKSAELRVDAELKQVLALMRTPKYFPVLKEMAKRKFRRRKRFNWKTKTRTEILQLLLDSDFEAPPKVSPKDIVDVPPEFTDQDTGYFDTKDNRDVLKKKWLLENYGLRLHDIEAINPDEKRVDQRRINMWSLWKSYWANEYNDNNCETKICLEVIAIFKDLFPEFTDVSGNNDALSMVKKLLKVVCTPSSELDSPTSLFLSSLHKVQSVLIFKLGLRESETKDAQRNQPLEKKLRDNESGGTRKQIFQEFTQICDSFNPNNEEIKVSKIVENIPIYARDKSFRDALRSSNIYMSFGDYMVGDISFLVEHIRSVFQEKVKIITAFVAFVVHMMVSYNVMNRSIWEQVDEDEEQ